MSSLSGSDHIEGKTADEGHVLSAIASATAGVIFLEDDIEDPVQALDAPMAADRLCGALWGEAGGGDEVSGVARDLALALDLRGRSDEAFQGGKARFAGVTAVAGKPVNLVADRGGAGFDFGRDPCRSP